MIFGLLSSQYCTLGACACMNEWVCSWRNLHPRQLSRTNGAALPRMRPLGFSGSNEEPRFSVHGAVAQRTSSDLMLTLRTRSEGVHTAYPPPGGFYSCIQAHKSHTCSLTSRCGVRLSSPRIFFCVQNFLNAQPLKFHKRFPHPRVKKNKIKKETCVDPKQRNLQRWKRDKTCRVHSTLFLF